MKQFVIAVFLSMMFYTSVVTADRLEGTAALLYKAEVTVLDKTDGGSGAGFYIGNGYLVTAAHVVLNTFTKTIDTIDIVTWRNKTYRAEVLGVSTDYDTALLRVKGLILPRLVFRLNPVLGEQVLMMGSPIGYNKTLAVGYVSRVRESASSNSMLPKLQDVLQLDIKILQGDSGGPVVDIQGRVLGMLSYGANFGRARAQGMGFAIKSRDIVPALRSIKALYDFPDNRQW